MKPDEHKAARSRRYQKKDGNAEAAEVAAQRRQQRQQQRQQQRPGAAADKGKDDAEDEDDDEDGDNDEDGVGSRGGAAFARRAVQSNTYRYRDVDDDGADPAKVLLQSTQELLAMLEVSAAQAIGSMVEAPPVMPDWASDAVDPTTQRLLDSLFAVNLGELGTILSQLSVADRLLIDPKTRKTLLSHQPALFERADMPRGVLPHADAHVDAPRGVPPLVNAPRGVSPSPQPNPRVTVPAAVPAAAPSASPAKQPAGPPTAAPAAPTIVRSAEQAQLGSDLDALLDL